MKNVLFRDTYFIQMLAKIAHDVWSHWMKYMFSQCVIDNEGNAIIPVDKVQRWVRQMNTEYKNLSESEKESDVDIAEEFMVAPVTKYITNILDGYN